MRIAKATYDGQHLLLDEPLSLPPNTRVTVTVHVEDPEAEPAESALAISPAAAENGKPRRKSFADAVRRLRIDGPSDWSERVDYYMGKDLSGGAE
ncbi:MAG TPA: hypothetical protein VFS20_10155 [Longimicrobium sp.]|nr:hypothetical protein [Longimicrobium sp.]